MVFILDRSGSMHGPSIAQAKSALVTALSRLEPSDRFNVIAFSDESFSAFPSPVDATPNNLGIVGGFIGAIDADGGTEMSSALELALGMQSAGGDSHRLKQIVLLTDGAVGNEDQLFRLIASRLGNTRLFTIGIGSAPNSWFMRKSAEVGRGTFTHIGDVNQVEQKISSLLAKLEEPVLTDIEISVSDGKLEMIPDRIPDLYRGEPIVFTGELAGDAPTITISGTLNGNPWRTRVDLDGTRARASENVASMWARRRIEQELDRLIEGTGDEAQVRTTVLELALRYSLVSPYTSLVAVEEERARPEDADLMSVDVPRHLPEGWSAEHVFGIADPESASDRAEAEPFMLKVAQARTADGRYATGVPQTATAADLMALLGLLLLIMAVALAFWRRKPPVGAAVSSSTGVSLGSGRAS
jgi:Ca-activated chloride channel family protein